MAGQTSLIRKGDVAVAPVHVLRHRNSMYVQMVRRSIYETKRTKHPHFPISRYQLLPQGHASRPRYKIQNRNSHLWNHKYSLPHTKLLGFVVCRVTSKIIFIFSFESSWGDVMSIKYVEDQLSVVTYQGNRSFLIHLPVFKFLELDVINLIQIKMIVIPDIFGMARRTFLS